MFNDNFGTFAVSSNLVNTLRTGNVLLDIIIGTLICTLITKANSLDIEPIFNKIRTLWDKYTGQQVNSIFIEDRAKNLSDTFKGILFYIEQNKLSIVPNLIQQKENIWNKSTDDFEMQLIYLPEIDIEYEIQDDLFIKLGNREKKIEGGNHELYDDMKSIKIYSTKLSSTYIKDFISKCADEWEEFKTSTILKHQSFFTCSYDSSEKKLKVDLRTFNTNTSFDNLFFDQKEELIQKFNNFLNGKEWYDQVGIPYTFGILLHGDPGCGKTKFIKAILKYIDERSSKRVHGISINLNDSFNLDELENILTKSKLGDWKVPLDQRVFIFEDIDCMGNIVKDRNLVKDEKKKEAKKLKKIKSKVSVKTKKDSDDESSDSDCDISKLISNSNKNSMSRLLNILDGVIETPGRIIIATTNKPDELDPAIKRGGRMDIHINFTKCSKEMAKDIINKFYNSSFNIDDFAKFKEFEFTPAELIQKCFGCKDVSMLFQQIEKN